LSVSEKWLNRLLSSFRVVVEHSIAGIKRCRIVKEVLRLRKAGISERVLEIACGLHNLRLSCRHPLPTFDLLEWARAG
jgi:DDE superfamily endonuclease